MWKILSLVYLLTISSACNAVEFSPEKTSAVQNIAQAYPAKKITNEAQMWQIDPYLRNYAQEMLRNRTPIAEDGAIATNRKRPEQVQVGWQRGGFDGVAFGVATGDKLAIQQGILAFRWAFERQSPDGSFGVSEYPEVVTFLGAYARSLLLLKQAGFTSEFEQLALYLPQMHITLSQPNFVAEEKLWEEREASNPVTNQVFWAAFSYKMIHLAQKNPRLDDQAKIWLQRGLNRQQADGVFPEGGGSDTTYQAVSLKFLSLYSFYSPKDKELIKTHLSNGFAWLYRKVLPDGTIDVSENTRTGKNQEIAPDGKFKEGRFGEPLTYIYWSYLGGGREARQMAVRVYEAKRSLTQGTRNLP